MKDRLLGWRDLADVVPYSRQHLSRLEARGEFPQRVQVGANRVAWRALEIEDWLANRQRGCLPIRVRPARTRPGRAA